MVFSVVVRIRRVYYSDFVHLVHIIKYKIRAVIQVPKTSTPLNYGTNFWTYLSCFKVIVYKR